MAAFAIERTYPTLLALARNAPSVLPLYTDNVVETMQFQLSGTLTNAGWATAPVKRVEGIENLIANLQLAATGKGTGTQSDTFCNVDAAYLAYQTRCQETTLPLRTDVGTANASYNFLSTFTRYCGLKRAIPDYALGFLDPRFFSTFGVTIQWRDEGAVIQPGTGTGGGTSVLSNVNLSLHTREWTNAPLNPQRPYLRQTQRRYDLTLNNGLDQPFLNAPVGKFLGRQTYKTTAGDVNYADPTDAIFTTNLRPIGSRIRLIQGDNFPRIDISASQMRALMKTDYSIESLPTGYLTYESSRTGFAAQIADLRGAQTLRNVFDITPVSGVTNTLQITDEEIAWPARGTR